MLQNPLYRLSAAFAVPIPAFVLRLAHIELPPVYAMCVYGAAVVGAAVLLTWAAETAQLDISGSLSVALLAFIAVLPEYAVDLYFAYAAGEQPEYVHYAAANMTGSNRLLIGLGWPLVAFVAGLALAKAKRQLQKRGLETSAAVESSPASAGGLTLQPRRRIELFFLGLAAVYSFTIPLTHTIALYDSAVLLAIYAVYIWRVAKEERGEPELEGVCKYIGCFPRRNRRAMVSGMFVAAATFILAAAEPFADSLIATGQALGIDEFMLVQWLAPLVSESPELIVACLLAYRLKGDDGIGTLLSSKVNQWTLLVASIPLAYLAGGGDGSLTLDARQTEEFILTAAQTVLGFAVLANLKFSWWEAAGLAALFLLQFPFPETSVRLGFSAAYIALALFLLVRHRRGLPPMWAEVFSKNSRKARKAQTLYDP